MDYSIINQVYEEIINIVNYYAWKSNCDYEVARKLSFTLLGYYLVMGPEVFSKINIVLDALVIHECQSKEEYQDELTKIKGRFVESNFNPIMTWKYQYDDNNKFLGGVPYIIYMKGKDLENVLSLAHELSHSLEGTGASVLDEEQEYVSIAQGFGLIKVKKETNSFKIEEEGFSELVAASIETRVAQSLVNLDSKEIENPLLKEFISSISEYKGKNVLAWSYEIVNMAFKDLMDNELFFELIRKYFYENNEVAFKEEYQSYGEGLRYSVLKSVAQNLNDDNSKIAGKMQYISLIQRQSEIFSRSTDFDPDKRVLILV